MAGFNFEKNLEHQTRAVAATVGVFAGFSTEVGNIVTKQYANPRLTSSRLEREHNIRQIRAQFGVTDGAVDGTSTIIDIMMETGTGKTYTYTKTMFELNQEFGIFKFVVVVPTLPIKAGTINFLKSDSTREHFKEQYGKTLTLHVVESKSAAKGKKSLFPPAVQSFVNAGNFEKNQIQVLVINAGMVNSDTMQKQFDTSLFDMYSVPFAAIAAVSPIMIIDEPHKFTKESKTWANLARMQAQYMLRYGATFPDVEVKKRNALGKTEKVLVKDYHNLIYTLTAVDSFNQNLVKGVIGHITEFEAGQNSLVKLVSINGAEAHFELTDGVTKTARNLAKGDSLAQLHTAMAGLTIENINKTTVVLSSGLELKRGDKINPYSYAVTLQETMIQKAVKNHFALEQDLMQREVKIKPLTLFFIDNIEEYRSPQGYLRQTVERCIAAEATRLLALDCSPDYRTYLEQSIADVPATHGGYFSKDNSDSDEKIEKEVNEILHDKEAILKTTNPRRFIFSKWTLREGWDNPNVFQICKLRSSGSDISKLQEVGRGLRLPVNEYGSRVKDEQFFLHYFVDFTENNFVDSLIQEINKKSGAISRDDALTSLTAEMVKQMVEKYGVSEEDLLTELDTKGVITRTNQFKEGGLQYIQTKYGLIFEGVDANKVRKATDVKKRITVRTEKYAQLQDLWEKLNQKVILEYKIETEAEFKLFLTKFLSGSIESLRTDTVRERQQTVVIEGNQATSRERVSAKEIENNTSASMKYGVFLRQLAVALSVNLTTLHESIGMTGLDISPYLNPANIRLLKQKFDNYLLYNAIDTFGIEYKKITNTIHPTKLTTGTGSVRTEIAASDVGVLYSSEVVAPSYLFSDLFYDSELEKQNILSDIAEVQVFTKIPKNSIKIPVSGGRSYSPDFAYVLNYESGAKKLYFIVEAKNAEADGLREEEKEKIRHAEKFFNDEIKVMFTTQFSQTKIVDLIRELVG